jgi:hypothetical protein
MRASIILREQLPNQSDVGDGKKPRLIRDDDEYVEK